MKEEKVTANRRTVTRLRNAVAMFLKSSAGRRAKWLMAALLTLMLCINGMNVANSYVGRYFMSAIEKRDVDGFTYFAWLYVGVFASTTVVAVFFRFTEERLGLLWREWMTRRAVDQYIEQRIYLHLEETGAITNPDQRISEDVKALTVTTLSLVLMILNSTVTVISFAGVLWAISPKLFVVSVLYAIIGSVLTILLGRPLISLNYRQSDFEADFRSELIHVREHAEGIALARDEVRTQKGLLARVDRLVGNFRRITSINRNLNFFTTGYNYLIQLIPTLIVAPIFIRRGVEFGIIGQSAMAFATLVAALSLIVTQFQSISAYASVITRLGELLEASDKAATRDSASCIGCSYESDHFIFENLTLHSGDEEDRILLSGLNVSFVPGKQVLVTGLNEPAKLALFRASAGLNDAGSGTILRPPKDEAAFLPEQPYLPYGTLRDLLVPARIGDEVSDDKVRAVLQEIGLGHVLAKHDGFEEPRNWHEVLSFGEQQLLAVARVIISAGRFAFLNRPHSALGSETLNHVLRVLANRGITCVSFGNGPPERGLYDFCLELNEDGSWRWTEAA